jgi:hypothetical protein
MVQQLSTVSNLPVGAKVASLRRVLFSLGADLHGSEGPLEIGFANGQVFLFECGASGEDLKVTEGLWLDPFTDPLSPENEKFLLESGKWEVLDLGVSLWSYRRFVGMTLDSIDSPSESSARLTLSGGAVAIFAVADELRVEFSRA